MILLRLLYRTVLDWVWCIHVRCNGNGEVLGEGLAATAQSGVSAVEVIPVPVPVVVE
jgi:hypothetical protein